MNRTNKVNATDAPRSAALIQRLFESLVYRNPSAGPATYRVDRMRVWKATAEYIASGEVRPPDGKVFVVRVVGIEDHPGAGLPGRPGRRRKKR